MTRRLPRPSDGAVIQLDPATGRLSGDACAQLAPQPQLHHLHVSAAARRGHPVVAHDGRRHARASPGAARAASGSAAVRAGWCWCGWRRRDPGWPRVSGRSGDVAAIRRRLQDRRPVDRRPSTWSEIPASSGLRPAIRRVHLHLYPAGDLDARLCRLPRGPARLRRDPAGADRAGQVRSRAGTRPDLPATAGAGRGRHRHARAGRCGRRWRWPRRQRPPPPTSGRDRASPADGLLPQGLAAIPSPAPRRTASTRGGPGRCIGSVPALRLAYPDDAFHRRIAGVVLGGFAAGGPAGRAAPDRARPLPAGGGRASRTRCG